MDSHGKPIPATSAEEELVQAHAELMRHSFGYLKSMALSSAVKLGIPDAIHHHGGAASLPELLAILPLPQSKQPYLPRLMKMLAVAGIFGTAPAGEGCEVRYCLTPVSRLLVRDAAVNGGACRSPVVLVATSAAHLTASARLHEWLLQEEVETPFAMAHGGEGFFGVAGGDGEYSALNSEAKASESRREAETVVRACGPVFEGITSLVDVGGGNGTAAMAIARAFPHVKCTVLELPHVVDAVRALPREEEGAVEFVAGDMMQSIPPADAILFKYVLHNWSDEDCVGILTRCREAIPSGGKVIIIDTVVGFGSPSHEILESQLLMDMCMMVLLDGKERDEQCWGKIFMEAGFSHYKIKHLQALGSAIEVYV